VSKYIYVKAVCQSSLFLSARVRLTTKINSLCLFIVSFVIHKLELASMRYFASKTEL